MSVLKLSKKDITINNSDDNKIKLKKDQLSYDSAMLSGWEATNKSAIEILNSYNTKLQNKEYLTADDIASYKKAVEDYISSTNNLRGINKVFGNGYTDEEEKAWTDNITSLQSSPENLSNFYSQFKSEDDYNSWDKREKFIESYLTNPTKATSEFEYEYAWVKEADRRKTIQTTKSYQDFDEYSQKGLSIENPSAWDSVKGLNVGYYNFKDGEWQTWRPFAESVNNKATFARDAGELDLVDTEYYKYRFMTEDEVNTYSYYLAKEGEKKADEFLDSLEDVLAQRQGGFLAENIQKADLELYMSITAGLDQWASGVKNLDNFILGTEADNPSAIQYASAEIRENIDSDFWRGAYDLGVTISNQLPSILVGTLTSNVGGLATMGAGIVGNSYAEMRNLGYNEWQARGYATLVTAAELGLQSVMGGISSLGGSKSLSRAALNALDSVDNGIARVALKLGANMFSEGLEEATQSVLEPIFKSIFTGEFEGVDWGEVAYSGILGALSAGFLESGKTIAGDVVTTKTGKAVKEAGGVKRLTDLASTFSTDSVAYQMAGKVNENTGAYKIGRLYQEAGATLSEQNKADIIASLEKQGVPTKYAKKLAEQYQAFLNNEMKLTDEQVKMLENCTPLTTAIREKLINQNLTSYQMLQQSAIGRDTDVYQRTRSYADVLDLANEISGVKSNTATPISQAEIEKRTSAVMDEFNAANSTYRSRIETEQANLFKTEESSHITQTTPTQAYTVSIEGKTVRSSDGEEINIKGIASNNNGQLKLRLDNDEVVDAKDVSFKSKEEALLYEMVADLGVTVNTAKSMMDFYGQGNTSIESYRSDAPLAYKYGLMNYVKGLANLNLSQEQKTALFGLGRTDAGLNAKARVEANKSKTVMKSKKNGITYEGFDVSKEKLKPIQEASVKTAEFISKVSNLEVHVYKSFKENGKIYAIIDGKKQEADNGYFISGTNKIYLDINAGDTQQGVMLYTMSHEVGHYIREWNAEEFKALGDFIFEHYNDTGYPVDTLINRQIDKIKADYKAEGKPIPSKIELFDMAYEEVVCDALSRMFADPNTFTEFAKQLETKNKTLWQKLGEAIKNFLDKVKKLLKVYSNQTPDSPSASLTEGFDRKTFEKLQEMYVKAFLKADENFSSAQLLDGMIQIDAESQSVSPSVMKSARTWTESEYVQKREEAAKEIAKALGVSISKAKSYIDDINSIAKMIADDKTRLDYEASPFGSAFVSNVEYGGSFDFTTLCKKRRFYTGTFSEIQKRLRNTALTPDDILKIRNMLLEKHLEATCGLCYVEGSRANMGKFAKEFIRLYKRDNPNAWIPDMADVNTPDGVESMRINHPEAYEKYEYFWNHYGKLKDSDPALFASQQKPKLYESRKEYKGEILKSFSDDSTVEKKNLNGGIRMQSFSDFEIVHMIDTMQIIMDMSRVGLAGQAYTKVPEFAESFGNTGLKINLSLIAKGVDADGNLIFDDREGMPHETAFNLRNKYSKNVGTILVVFTDKQLLSAMADPRIDYIIPFHRSQWKQDQYAAMGLPKGTKDYTNQQNEKLIEKTYHEYRGRMVEDKASNYMPNEYWDFSKSGKENAEAYLKMCAENNKRPKFYKFLDYDGKGAYSLKKDGSTDGYWKLLIDFKMYDNDGVGSPQQAVTPNFSMDEATRILDEYKGGHQSYPVAHDVVDNFVKEYEKSNIKKSKREVTEISSNEYRKIVDNFGTTKNYEVAGYLLKNGLMLDFSGKHWGDDYSTSRQVDHRDISEAYSVENSDNGVGEMINMISNGNIRLMPETGGINLAVMPNESQISQLRGYINHFRGEIIIDIDEIGGDTIRSWEYNRGTSSSKILSDIKEYFENGTIPQQQSSLNQFRYSKRDYQDNELIKAVNAELNDVATTGHWTAKHLRDLYAKHPELDFIVRIGGDDSVSAISELTELVSTISDKKLLNNLLWYPVYARGVGFRKPYRKAINTYNKVINKRISEIVDGNAVGLKARRYELSEIREMFNSLNSNPDITKLADKVFELSKKLNLEISGQNGMGDSYGRALRNQIAYSVKYFNDITIDNQRKAQTILHELIHSCTVYAINAVHGINTSLYFDENITNGMRKAVNSLDNIYHEIQIDSDFAKEYGIKNTKEMVAELANPVFREKLKAKSLWQHIVDAIRRIFGIETKSAFEGVSVAVEYILDNFDEQLYKRYVSDLRNRGSALFDKGVKYSKRESYAPTFYSQMSKVVEGIKQDKFAANSVVSMLRGRGVKAEEIRWSGIVTWLENKKSVTKQELLDFIASSQLQIGEQMSGNDIDLRYNAGNRSYTLYDKEGNVVDKFIYNEFLDGYIAESNDEIYSNGNELEEAMREEYGVTSAPRWSQYKLDGGDNYREIVFTMPNSTYTNRAMKGHWGSDAEGVLVHARIQDFVVDGKKMLFIEELQSDWHNEGHAKGYSNKEYEDAVATHDELYNKYKKLDLAFHKYIRSNDFMTDPEDVRKKKSDWLRGKVDSAQKKYLDAEKVVNSLKEKGAGDTPDAPFKDTYHEFVLKRLLRLAAEEGYDSLGWTIADTQSKRWSYDYEKAYQIEYDQEMPRFLSKYGRQWGAKVEKSTIEGTGERTYKADNGRTYSSIRQWIDSQTRALILAQGEHIKDRLTVEEGKLLKLKDKKTGHVYSKLNINKGTEIWSMDLTDSMKDTVLHEGQRLYSKRDNKPLNETIKEGMTESERYEVLKKRQIKNIPSPKTIPNSFFEKHSEKYSEISSWDDIDKYFSSKKREVIQKIANEFGIFDKEYFNEDIDLEFEFTGNSFRKTFNKQKKNYIEFAKMFSCFDSIIESAVGVEIHNRPDYKPDATLDNMFVLMSAYQDGDFIIPVKLEVKKFKDKQNKLYVAISLEKIKKTEVWKQGNTNTGVTQNSRSVNISIANIFAKINPSDKNFLKYIPDGFLNEDQKVAKQEALKKDGENSDKKSSKRDTDSISNRSLLANALESTAQNDIEKNKLAQYKSKIDLINAEEQRLQEINQEMHDLLFTKGRRDADRIRELRFEQKQAENRINTYDRQLLTLEASKPLKDVLEREKKLVYKKAKQEGKEALAAYREKSAQTTRELMNRYQESRKKAAENKHKTELRGDIKKVVSKLNQLLLRPTKDKHVKEELQKAVAEALFIINMDTVGAEKRVAVYDELLAKTNDPDMIAELTLTRNRIEVQGETLKEKLDALKTAYEKIKNSQDSEMVNAYQEVILNSIENVSNIAGNTPIRYMSLEQLEAVYEMYSMILHAVNNANKMFKAKKGETITQTAEKVNAEVRKFDKGKFARVKGSKDVRSAKWSLLKPLIAFRTIGSDTFTDMYNEIRNGEDVYYNDIREAKSYIHDQYNQHNYKAWDKNKTWTFKDKMGDEFTLNLEQIMSLYAYSRREQALAHIMEGGIVLKDNVIVKKNKLGIPIKYEVDTNKTFSLSEEILNEICNTLTKEQKAYVENMQGYLSNEMGDKGNEVSMEMLGIKLFKEEYYFPLKSSQDYMDFKPQEAGEIKLKNASFSKATVQHANNPVILNDFTDVWSEHVHDMSMYHAFVLPLEDFTRVFNYKTKTNVQLKPMSTKQTITDAHGDGAITYIRNFLTSLNGGVRVQNVGIVSKTMSLFKKGAVLASASVAIQQPSAIMRAMAYINPIYFVAATPKSINLINHNKAWAELKQYAPIAGIKEMGRFDVGMGQDTVAWIKDQKTFKEKADDVLSKAPAYMDEVTWVSIWEAVKKEVAAKNKDLKGEEFLKKCGERFTEVVSLSQVYDSVFSRSDIMRNKNDLAKMLTAFMAEPTTTLNMVWDALVQGKRTGTVKGFLAKTSVTTGAILGSIVLNSLLKSIITAMRDDDDEESYLEKYVEAFVGNTKDNANPFTYIPFVKDIVSIFEGYDVERMDMALFSDLYQALENMDSENKTEYEKWTGLIGAISAFAGVPFKNVERDIRGAYNTIRSFIEGRQTTQMGIETAIREGFTGKEVSRTQQLYEAYLRDDTEQIERVKAMFKDPKKTDKEVKSEIESALRKGLRDNDPRIKEAAQAVIDGNPDERIRITRELIAEGHFTSSIIIGAINAELTYLKQKLKEED